MCMHNKQKAVGKVWPDLKRPWPGPSQTRSASRLLLRQRRTLHNCANGVYSVMRKPLHTVVEMESFVEEAKTIFTMAEREDLILFLAETPDAGDLIAGTGGARKLRWGAMGKGKRGGARVITYYADHRLPVFILACFAKSKKADMSPNERAELKTVLKAIAESYNRSNNR